MKDDAEVVWSDMTQGVEDNCRQCALELDNDAHGRKVRVTKALGYIDEAKEKMQEVLDRWAKEEEEGGCIWCGKEADSDGELCMECLEERERMRREDRYDESRGH
jgi:hypothetical protein